MHLGCILDDVIALCPSKYCIHNVVDVPLVAVVSQPPRSSCVAAGRQQSCLGWLTTAPSSVMRRPAKFVWASGFDGMPEDVVVVQV
jgi:hypothetical protein